MALRQNPKFAAALRACGGPVAAYRAVHSIPHADRVKLEAVAACVRRHGFSIPSLNFSGTGPLLPPSVAANPRIRQVAGQCAHSLGAGLFRR